MRHALLGWMTLLSIGMACAAESRTVVLDVNNMTCPACRLTIEKALDQVPGVSERHVDTQAASVTVTIDPARTSESAVAQALTDAGFPAAPRPNDG